MQHQVDAAANEGNHGALVARVAEVYAPEDARTKARLDWLVKVGGRCRGCGKDVHDAALVEHPGVCMSCHRRKKLQPLTMPPELAVPTITPEIPMPCSTCGTAGHNARGCPKSSKAKKAPGDAQEGSVKPEAAKVTTLRPATPRRAKAAGDLGAIPLDELLEKRSEAAGLVAAVDAELRRRRDEIAKALESADRETA